MSKRPFNQDAIDRVRARVVLSMLTSAVLHDKVDQYDGKVWHLWFPERKVGKYELRDGNPPPDDKRDRPRHLLGKKLAIDLKEVPADVWDDVRTVLKAHSVSKEKLTKTKVDAVRESVIVGPDGLPTEG